METWKPVDGWSLYDVSDLGRIRSWNSRGRRRTTPKVLAGRPDSKGYLRVCLCANGQSSDRFIHQLVLEAFAAPRPAGTEGRHMDGQRTNNAAGNLEWATHAVNMRDQYKHGTRALGERHGMAKLTRVQADEIRASVGTCRSVGERYGVAASVVCNIRSGKKWARPSNGTQVDAALETA